MQNLNNKSNNNKSRIFKNSNLLENLVTKFLKIKIFF